MLFSHRAEYSGCLKRRFRYGVRDGIPLWLAEVELSHATIVYNIRIRARAPATSRCTVSSTAIVGRNELSEWESLGEGLSGDVI